MKILPQPKIVYLKIDGNKAGALDTSSRSSAIEVAEVLEVPTHDGCNEDTSKCKYWYVHKGDRVFVKSWAVDIIDYEGKKYHFVNIDTGGILAIIK